VLVVAGCCSTRNDIQYAATSDLQLRRYDLKHCLSMAHTSWDKQLWQSVGYNDLNADFEEKAAIEREITRRGVTDYYWASACASGKVLLPSGGTSLSGGDEVTVAN